MKRLSTVLLEEFHKRASSFPRLGLYSTHPVLRSTRCMPLPPQENSSPKGRSHCPARSMKCQGWHPSDALRNSGGPCRDPPFSSTGKLWDLRPEEYQTEMVQAE